MPGAGFQRFASKSRELKIRGRDAPMRAVKAEMVTISRIANDMAHTDLCTGPGDGSAFDDTRYA
jgi:hypothetical protein